MWYSERTQQADRMIVSSGPAWDDETLPQNSEKE